MNIKVVLPVSLADWPGKIATLVFVGGCNLRCPWCQNAELVRNPDGLPDIPVESVLKRISEDQLLDGVLVTGGEPTLQPDLVEFAKSVKALGLGFALETNGTHPKVVKKLASQNLLDFAAVDVKAPPEKYSLLTGTKGEVWEKVEETLRILDSSGVAFELRTTWVPALLTPEDIKLLVDRARSVCQSRPKHVLYRFKQTETLDPLFRSPEPTPEETKTLAKNLEIEWR